MKTLAKDRWIPNKTFKVCNGTRELLTRDTSYNQIKQANNNISSRLMEISSSFVVLFFHGTLCPRLIRDGERWGLGWGVGTYK